MEKLKNNKKELDYSFFDYINTITQIRKRERTERTLRVTLQGVVIFCAAVIILIQLTS